MMMIMEGGSAKMEGISDVDDDHEVVVMKESSSFLDRVFSWSIEDIFNDNLFSEKVTKIPESFDTVPQYFSSYVYPLLEETRADLRSSLEILSRAPFAEVLSYEESKHRDSLMYDINVDGWQNRFNDRGKEPYKTLPGDIFALVKSRPESITDMRMVAQTWVLAAVTRISRDQSGDEIDDESSSTFFLVKTSKDIGELDDNFSSLFLVFLMNITTNKRIWNALHTHVNLKILRGLLGRNIADEERRDLCCTKVDDDLPRDLCLDSSRLNASQNEAVLASLQALQYDQKSHVQLVWGPPGTGKTKTISTLLHSLLKMNVRTLTCAPTNVAIMEVAIRVLELIRNSSEKDPAEKFGFLGNILLFGNKKRLRVGLNVEDIFLDYRVKRLAECFAPLTGWRSCFPCLSNFLKDCVSEYNIFFENELIKAREQSTGEADTTRHIESFLIFLRHRFKAAAEPVRHFISIFGTHLSRSYIGECNLENMICLIDLLCSFEEMLLQDDVDSAELLKVFSAEEVEDSPISNLPLIEVNRRKCINVLKTLHCSLSELDLPSVIGNDFLTELCFKTASLIFCTASSSSRLYFLPVEPLSLLVIDEAAQLKECESAIPLQLPGVRHAVLFGDECQLPAMVKSNISKEAGFGRSLFQRLSLLGWPKHLLNVQYRMHPSISAFPNDQFYFNQLLDAPSVKSKAYERFYLAQPMYGPYTFLNISEGRDELDDDGRSRRNMVEAAVVAKILQNLYKAWRHSTQRLAVGVVSPYAAQVVAIEDILGRRYDKLANFGVKVKSVDGFQGGEEDIIILSTVRSNNAGQVGFISDLQRTNVALTRARHCLWVLGNERTLARSDSIWKTLVCNAKERKCLFEADEDKSLAEAMIDIKKELNQLDDLLNKDSVVFKSARWKVLFSDNFVKSFSKLPTNRTKKSVMNLLVKLSNGWRPRKIKVDPVCESTIQIVKQYKVEGRYVICTNDIMKEAIHIQVMKIWDIVPLEEVSKLVRRLDNIYGAFTDVFLNRCKERSVEGELEVPRTWSTSLDIVRYKSNSAELPSAADGGSDGVAYAENAKVSESLLLMKFYSLSAGIVGHLLSDSDGRALDLPFEVTDQEMKIILDHKSSFILGRSGTGKTTVLTMKLFQRERLHHMASEGLADASNMNTSLSDENEGSGTVLRQLFVTVSPKLCYAIKQHVSHLSSFARGESSSTESVPIDVDDIDDKDQFTGIPDSFVGVPPKSYPLVITFNKFLFMLDGTIGTSYFDRFHDEMEFFYGGSTSSTSLPHLMRSKEVDYDKFSMSYWPHFNTQLTKKLDASRVFTEIISSIKGGLQAGGIDHGRLSLEDYLQLSGARTSTLSRQKREAIYQIFVDYEKMKGEQREFDLADFVNDLHRRLKHERYDGDIIDFVYIDEVQDLTMRQIALFKYICKNVDEGFVFSGDTAQTIARGIDFRFQDVRCLFYKEFMMSTVNDGLNGNHQKVQMSPIFHLSENFRTHAGILKLGQCVIELIYHFFPHSIDILPPESSRIFGEAPILLESGSDENAIVTIFGNNGNMGTNLVGFGAEQVILVRNDSVRKEISDFVGKNALVLTIVECKGLEFQDVLLYNFFGSSPLKNQWRVLYEYMKLKNLLDETLPVSFPQFSSGKHNGLCSELKQLYVAITRTRQRLWICENKEDLSKPVFDYWKNLCVVQVRQLDDSLARAMQVASSPEEWKARGRKLLDVENYEVATMCFERAGDRHWEIFAKAAGLKASANRMLHLNPREASNVLRQAAELFESINVNRRAADCYYDLKEYDKAGKLYYEHCGESYIQRAGECFMSSGCYELAANVYAKGNLFSECLSSCTKGKLFDMGLQYIQYWKQQKTDRDFNVIEQEFLENCARFQYQQDDKRAMMTFVKAFSSEDYMRTFLIDLGCLDDLLVLEEQLGNFSKAADIAREIGDLELEADLLQKGGLFREAYHCFLSYAFANCLWANGGKGWPLKHFKHDELLLKAKTSADSIEQHLLSKIVVTDILLLLPRDYSLSELQELLVWSQNLSNMRGKILSTRRILDSILHIDASKYEVESDLINDLARHAVQSISENKVSVETLIYFWNSWKETILAMSKYLDAVEADDTFDMSGLGEFCLNYLGVRKLSCNANTVFVCLYPDAEWLKEVDKNFFQKFGKLVSIDMHQLLAAARDHWFQELLSTGMKTLNVLEALQKDAKRSPLSAFSKSRILLHVYEVAQLLSSLKTFKKYNDSKLLQGYTEFSIAEYFASVFPIDWRKSGSMDIIHLRETEVSTKVLEAAILKNIQGKEPLTYGQLGRVAMGLLGSRKRKAEICDMVLRKLDRDSPWKPFFEVLSVCSGSEASNRTMSNHVTCAQGQLEKSLSFKLHGALLDAYNSNWRKFDYISPSSFLYLVDRLVVSLLEFQGRLVITRSSLVEWFIHVEWKPSLDTDLLTDGRKSVFVRDTYCFWAGVVHHLLMNTHETVEWVKRIGINAKENFPGLLLRLVLLMCLLHLNSGMYRDKLLDVINRKDVTTQLPLAFNKALWRWKTVGFVNAVSDALAAIGDPLVLVSTGEIRSNFSCKKAIDLDIVNKNREDLLAILFPSEVNSCQGRVGAAISGSNVLHVTSFSDSTDNQAKVVKDSPSNVTNKECQFYDGNVWKLFDTLKLVENDDSKSRQRFASNAPNIKVQIDKMYELMTTAIPMASDINTCAEDYSKLLAESDHMLLELRLLSAILGISQLKDSMLLIRDCAKKLLSGKHVFEYFLGPLNPPKDPPVCVEKSETEPVAEDTAEVDTEAADEESNLEESQIDDISAAAGAHQKGSNDGNKSKGKANKKRPPKKARNKKNKYALKA